VESLVRFFVGSGKEISTSKAQIKEISAVLKRPSLVRALPKGTSREVLVFFLGFKKLTKIYNPKKLPWDFGDRNDHFLLDLAITAKADFLVTGDKALRSLMLVGTKAIHTNKIVGRSTLD
jgi:putative PIN family toxin of toxin-antitoxin system